ncbi:MAG: hypothetical protein NTW45_03430 [Rhodocyclales bacterium]|nr:hypothetical protein [Rhodocyclales bacterium]
MQDEIEAFHQQVNHARFHGQAAGHYESFFLRANHPTRPLAFWIRYTFFSPRDFPGNAVGELWAVFFDGETNRHVVAKQEYPLAGCLFDTAAFGVRVGAATLGPHRLQGAVESRGQALAWDLAFEGESAPILLLPFNLYQGGFPAAKSLVSLPLARFSGGLSVNSEAIDVTGWVGSQNHNWGSRHTDLYAWGQVAGFDTHPESFLEVATAKLRIGPFWTPPLTPLVLRHGNRDYALTGLVQGLRARGSFGYFHWEFKSETAEVVIEGVISAPRQAFVGLEYRNPPGGVKHCLNSKIAACRLQFRDKRTGSTEILETKSRAAFEILTSDPNHGIAISA